MIELSVGAGTMFDLGIDVDNSFEEPLGIWFLFFTDGAGGLWCDGNLHIGRRIDEPGN